MDKTEKLTFADSCLGPHVGLRGRLDLRGEGPGGMPRWGAQSRLGKPKEATDEWGPNGVRVLCPISTSRLLNILSPYGSHLYANMRSPLTIMLSIRIGKIFKMSTM